MITRLRALLLKRFHIPKEHSLRRTMRSFSIAEKTVFYFFSSIFVLSGLILVARVNASFLVEIPMKGGTLVEGVIGNPRFINPVLALSEADKNLTGLVYSGLVRLDEHGKVENDLAGLVETSRDGLVYTAYIRPDAHFHDGVPVTADDVVFTVQKILDPAVKSPKRGNWEGVTVEKVNDITVSFTLKKPYAPFIENLSLGILPKYIWKNVSDDEFSFSQFNTLPIGSGPYKVAKVERNSGGIPDYYELEPFGGNTSGTPYIENLVFKFYPNEETLFAAYKRGEVESLGGFSPAHKEVLKSNSDIITSPLPRVFGVFFNQNESETLAMKEVRQALNLAAPREEIVNKVLGGFGIPIDGPLPAGIFSWTTERSPGTYEDRFAEAEKILLDAGWKKNENGLLEKKVGKDIITLSFSVSTSNAPELKAVAEELKASWERLGASVDILVFEPGDLNQSVIRPRKFEGLLFGEVVSRDADVYPFWHSSQRNDPGLNISLYANSRADRLLEEARSTKNQEVREERYRSFSEEMRKDVPAVFLYSPNYLYVLPEKVKDPSLGYLSAPQDRFLGIRNWYIDTNKVWKIFIN